MLRIEQLDPDIRQDAPAQVAYRQLDVQYFTGSCRIRRRRQGKSQWTRCMHRCHLGHPCLFGNEVDRATQGCRVDVQQTALHEAAAYRDGCGLATATAGVQQAQIPNHFVTDQLATPTGRDEGRPRRQRQTQLGCRGAVGTSIAVSQGVGQVIACGNRICVRVDFQFQGRAGLHCNGPTSIRRRRTAFERFCVKRDDTAIRSCGRYRRRKKNCPAVTRSQCPQIPDQNFAGIAIPWTGPAIRDQCSRKCV